MNTFTLYSKMHRLTMCVTISVFLFSCSNEDEPMTEVREEEHTVQMLFSAAPPTYADSDDTSEVKATRAATADWPDGARLYLRFVDNVATGTATYDAATSQWTLSYSGTLTADVDATCEVWYFENPTSADESSATLSPTTAIFYTASATYIYHSDKFHLRASLEPSEARLRYKGTPGTVLTVADWPHYTTFIHSSSFFSNSSEDDTFILTVGSDGYTPYIYGHSDVALLHVEIASIHFYYQFARAETQPGGSYSTFVPSESLVSDGNWSHSVSLDRSFTVTGNGKTITFSMICVRGGIFKMGDSSFHNVTLTKDYYMCESEVTQALWYAVMGQSPTSVGSRWSSSRGLGDSYPAYYISYEDCQSFLAALNSKLSSELRSGEQFRFPTEAEWEFAARGGNKSKGYAYSGSNSLGDVAWYGDNSSNTTHQVKTKAANELGLYDMSGNVWEWCYDWYEHYSGNAQTDPTGPTSGSDRVIRGGSWLNDADLCGVVISRTLAPGNRSEIQGLRLCLGAPIEQ